MQPMYYIGVPLFFTVTFQHIDIFVSFCSAFKNSITVATWLKQCWWPAHIRWVSWTVTFWSTTITSSTPTLDTLGPPVQSFTISWDARLSLHYHYTPLMTAYEFGLRKRVLYARTTPTLQIYSHDKVSLSLQLHSNASPERLPHCSALCCMILELEAIQTTET
jgi:hypothetical protein